MGNVGFVIYLDKEQTYFIVFRICLGLQFLLTAASHFLIIKCTYAAWNPTPYINHNPKSRVTIAHN